MILVIDTSSSTCVLATLDGNSRSELLIPARDPALVPAMQHVAHEKKVEKVAVAIGPGSFTGLRIGVSFGLGLAMGLRIPIIPLPSLDLQAARSDQPAIAVIEAGRGRVYFQVPGGAPMHGEPVEVPSSHALVGVVGPKTEASLIAAGHRFVPLDSLRGFAEAAAIVLEKAHEVAYGSLEIEYMQSFSPKR